MVPGSASCRRSGAESTRHTSGPGRRVPAIAIVSLVVALLAIGYIGLLSLAGTRGDSLQVRLMELPPARMPVIERSVAATPPAAVPVPADDVVERFRKFLAPEIAAGQVVVQGDAQRLMIRLLSRGMFESGSATVQGHFVDLLTRIGDGLRSEAGQVQVLGHSDNQPIRTVQFPSNFELSAARAEAARRILARSAGQAERFTAVGRADTEALAGNNTPEGREANRRIEIVLSRGTGR
jgi:type VI secretion system protein ImpK